MTNKTSKHRLYLFFEEYERLSSLIESTRQEIASMKSRQQELKGEIINILSEAGGCTVDTYCIEVGDQVFHGVPAWVIPSLKVSSYARSPSPDTQNWVRPTDGDEGEDHTYITRKQADGLLSGDDASAFIADCFVKANRVADLVIAQLAADCVEEERSIVRTAVVDAVLAIYSEPVDCDLAGKIAAELKKREGKKGKENNA